MAELLSETEYARQIAKLARTLGYKVVHHRPGKSKAGRWSTPTTEKGWPDDTFIRPPRILCAELKGPTTLTTPEQLEMLALLSACGIETYLWRSGETSLQQIADILAPRVRREPPCPAPAR